MPIPKPIDPKMLTEAFLDDAYDVLVAEITQHNNIGKALRKADISRRDLETIMAVEPRFEQLLFDASMDFIDDREDELWVASQEDPKIKVMMMKAHRPHRYDRSGVAQIERVRGQITAEQNTKGLIDGRFEEINEPIKVENSESRKLTSIREELSD